MTQQITALPTPPTRTDPNNFATRADAFLAALPTFGTEANVLASEVTTAALACAAAAQGVSLTAWVSGTTYAEGDVRYDTTDFKSYRRKTAGAGTTRPGLDGTNWALITGLGDVDTTSTQTISGAKTFSGVCSFTNTGAWSADTLQKDSTGRWGLDVAPSAWGSGYDSSLDIGATGAVQADTTAIRLVYNAYYDGTNWRAKTTGTAAMFEIISGVVTCQRAASVAAGAILTFAHSWRTSAVGNTIVGRTTDSGKRFQVESDSLNTSIPAEFSDTRTDTSSSQMVAFVRDTVAVGNISTTDAATAYNTSSDERLKRNVADAPEAGEIIDALRVRSFDWRRSGEHVAHGFIAQELVQVAPQAVSPGDDGPLTDESITWGIDPAKLVPLLVKESQSQRARIAALESTLAGVLTRLAAAGI